MFQFYRAAAYVNSKQRGRKQSLNVKKQCTSIWISHPSHPDPAIWERTGEHRQGNGVSVECAGHFEEFNWWFKVLWKGWRNRTALSRLSMFPGLARFYSVPHLCPSFVNMCAGLLLYPVRIERPTSPRCNVSSRGSLRQKHTHTHAGAWGLSPALMDIYIHAYANRWNNNKGERWAAVSPTPSL